MPECCTVPRGRKAGGQSDVTAWYLTQRGRAEFAAKVAARDEAERQAEQQAEREFESTIARLSVFERCNARADRQTRKVLADTTGWWRDAHQWIGFEVDHDPTMTQAIQGIALQCPNYFDARNEQEAQEHAAWQRTEASQWLDELADKARAKIKIEWIVIRDHQKHWAAAAPELTAVLE